MTRPPIRRPAPSGLDRRGFTLVELLVVFVVLALLIALLLPAIRGAVSTAKNTAAGTDLKQLDQALAAYKSRYGDYPPSRIVLWEDGFFRIGDTTPLAPAAPATTPAMSDMTLGQLAQRSIGYMRKFFPKAVFSTSAAVWASGSQQWYDFNGNGVFDQQPYVLQGHQCLTFFLGGLPQKTSEGFTMTGFAKNPVNPFTPSVAPASRPSFVSNNREAPLFEFAANRLTAVDPLDPLAFPGYMDTFGNSLGSGQINFVAYFSAYGNNAYDPNDVNFPTEEDGNLLKPILGLWNVRFPVRNSGGTAATLAASPAPNPYSSTETTAAVVSCINPQTYQLISSGQDGQYGIGGQYRPSNALDSMPFSVASQTVPSTNSLDKGVRQRERDNLTNFHAGRLD